MNRSHRTLVLLTSLCAACTPKAGTPWSTADFQPLDTAPDVDTTGTDTAAADTDTDTGTDADTGTDTDTDTDTGNGSYTTTPIGSSGPWSAPSCGAGDCCALTEDRMLACWGSDEYGQLDAVPSGPFAAVSVGWPGACALDDAGSIACWPGDPDAPWPEGAFEEVRASGYDGCALDSNGVLQCWGLDYYPEFSYWINPPNGEVFGQLGGGGSRVPSPWTAPRPAGATPTISARIRCRLKVATRRWCATWSSAACLMRLARLTAGARAHGGSLRRALSPA